MFRPTLISTLVLCCLAGTVPAFAADTAGAPLRWTQRDDAHVIDVPASLPSGIASSFRIGF